ncbi:hypothetical protein ACFJIW_10120 [Tahibacter sp. UC22_41]|uniref:hypothetical protein n=1 Tax=Tahibacter sp. UC22_41 TaxID=3350178 RepID=UPI0036DB3D9F
MPVPLPSAKIASGGYPILRKLRRHYRRKRRKKQVKSGKPCNSFPSFLRKYGNLQQLAAALPRDDLQIFRHIRLRLPMQRKPLPALRHF